jgi:hypothetical protein
MDAALSRPWVGRVALALVLILLVMGGGLSRSAYSAFSGATAAVSSFASAASFCAATPTAAFVAGFEAGTVPTGTGMWTLQTAGGTPAVDSTVKRNGGYSLKVAKTTGLSYAAKTISSTAATAVVRVAQRRIGVCRLHVAPDLRYGREHRALPPDLARHLVERIHAPFVWRVVGHGIDVAVQADLEAGAFLSADRRGQQQRVAPDHRTRVSEAGDRGLPSDRLVLRDIPVHRRRVPIVDPRRPDPAELRPVHSGPWSGGA